MHLFLRRTSKWVLRETQPMKSRKFCPLLTVRAPEREFPYSCAQRSGALAFRPSLARGGPDGGDLGMGFSSASPSTCSVGSTFSEPSQPCPPPLQPS